jgi:zinc protease
MKRVITLAALAVATMLALASAPPAQATPSMAPRGSLDPAAAGVDSPEDVVQPDPHVLLGRLANGMRYAIARTEGPPETTIEFYIAAGSDDETDVQRGTAHFLEHMAFSGSRSFPSGSVMPRFEDIGVALGRDQNAQTGFSGTTYSLDIPGSTDAKVDLAFRWLGDVADGLTIDPAEVDRERGTILSEYRESLSPGAAIGEKTGEFIFPDLLGSRRLPIGTLETIRSATAASIRAFYQKWYRPEDAILIVVSDEPLEATRSRIEQTFGAWAAATPPPVKPDLGAVDTDRGLDVATVSDPNVANVIQVCRAMNKDPVQPEDVAVHVRDLENQVWTSVLTKRLVRLTETPNPPLAAAQASRDDLFDRGSLACVSLGVRNQDWRAALKAAAVETQRMELYGLTPGELDATKAELRASLDASLAGGNTMTQKARADLMLENFLIGGTIDSVEEDYRIVSKAVDRLTHERVAAEFQRVWSQAGGPLIMLVSPSPVEPAAVRTAWLEDAAGPRPAPPVDEAGHAWAYTDFGPAGVVAHREVLSQVGATRIEFANGVRVNFKRLDNMPDKVFIRVRFGAGQEELATRQGFVAEIGALMLRAGGLGKNDFQDTVRLCETHSCDLSLSIARDAFVLQGATRVADLDVQLQLLTAFLTDPAFRPDLDAQLPTAVAYAFRQLRVDPDAVANRALQDAALRPHVMDVPTEAQAASARSTDFARLLGPPLKTAPLEVTVVGDLDEATAEAALARTLGAIAPRERRDRTPASAPHVRFPDPVPPPIHVAHDGPADETSVLMSWPLFVWDPAHLREQRAIELMGDMLQDELIETVRRELGKSYSPTVKVNLANAGDQGDIEVQLITAPDDAQAVIAETRAIVARYAAGDMTPEALERVRRPLLDEGQSRELTVGWWMDTLDGSWAHPDKIEAAQRWQSDFSGITLAEVQAEARRWLAQTPLLVVAAPKTAPHP